MEAYQKLLESIRLFDNNNIKLVDIHSGNMLYKNGDLYLLDFYFFILTLNFHILLYIIIVAFLNWKVNYIVC